MDFTVGLPAALHDLGQCVNQVKMTQIGSESVCPGSVALIQSVNRALPTERNKFSNKSSTDSVCLLACLAINKRSSLHM